MHNTTEGHQARQEAVDRAREEADRATKQKKQLEEILADCAEECNKEILFLIFCMSEVRNQTKQKGKKVFRGSFFIAQEVKKQGN